MKETIINCCKLSLYLLTMLSFLLMFHAISNYLEYGSIIAVTEKQELITTYNNKW